MAHTKPCIKCATEKPLSEFYVHPQMGDGHLNKCKDCCRTDSRNHRANNIEAVREFDRLRGQQPHRKANNRAYYARKKTDPAWMSATAERKRLLNQESPVKRAARQTFGYAKRQGKIAAPDNCERCLSGKPLAAHHEDYNQPLDVIWLCPDCHGLRHQEINAMIRSGVDLSSKGF